MTRHYNKATLIGRLTRDPETRTTASGIVVSRFTVAVDRLKRNEDGEKTTDYIRVVAWRRLAEIAGQYMKKGMLVAVEGPLQIESYVWEGTNRKSIEILAANIQMLERMDQTTRREATLVSD